MSGASGFEMINSDDAGSSQGSKAEGHAEHEPEEHEIEVEEEVEVSVGKTCLVMLQVG